MSVTTPKTNHVSSKLLELLDKRMNESIQSAKDDEDVYTSRDPPSVEGLVVKIFPAQTFDVKKPGPQKNPTFTSQKVKVFVTRIIKGPGTMDTQYVPEDVPTQLWLKASAPRPAGKDSNTMFKWLATLPPEEDPELIDPRLVIPEWAPVVVFKPYMVSCDPKFVAQLTPGDSVTLHRLSAQACYPSLKSTSDIPTTAYYSCKTIDVMPVDKQEVYDALSKMPDINSLLSPVRYQEEEGILQMRNDVYILHVGTSLPEMMEKFDPTVNKEYFSAACSAVKNSRKWFITDTKEGEVALAPAKGNFAEKSPQKCKFRIPVYQWNRAAINEGVLSDDGFEEFTITALAYDSALSVLQIPEPEVWADLGYHIMSKLNFIPVMDLNVAGTRSLTSKRPHDRKATALFMFPDLVGLVTAIGIPVSKKSIDVSSSTVPIPDHLRVLRMVSNSPYNTRPLRNDERVRFYAVTNVPRIWNDPDFGNMTPDVGDEFIDIIGDVHTVKKIEEKKVPATSMAQKLILRNEGKIPESKYTFVIYAVLPRKTDPVRAKTIETVSNRITAISHTISENVKKEMLLLEDAQNKLLEFGNVADVGVPTFDAPDAQDAPEHSPFTQSTDDAESVGVTPKKPTKRSSKDDEKGQKKPKKG